MSYWDKVLDRRIGRRRAILATGAITASAAFLAACGGDDDDGDSTAATGPQDTSGLLYQAQDRTNDAVRGGTWKTRIQQDPQNFDLYNFDPFSQPFANVVGTKLVKVAPTRNADPTAIDVTGDGAASWEISGVCAAPRSRSCATATSTPWWAMSRWPSSTRKVSSRTSSTFPGWRRSRVATTRS